MSGRVVGVTGASGFVGSAVAQALVEAGHQVIALARRPVPGYDFRLYDLAAPVPDGLMDDLDVVVHAAYDLTLTDPEAIATVNVQATEALMCSARAAGVRPILVSSMSAYAGTGQLYGRAKLAAEASTLSSGGDAVRVGLVWGGAEGGMIGTLRRLARAPVVPRLGRSARQFTVHVEDMAAAFVALTSAPTVGRPIGLAEPRPVPFEEIIRSMRDGSPPVMISIPWRPIYVAMRTAERVGIALPVRADSLLGLVQPASEVPNVEVWSRLGVRLRPFGAP